LPNRSSAFCSKGQLDPSPPPHLPDYSTWAVLIFPLWGGGRLPPPPPQGYGSFPDLFFDEMNGIGPPTSVSPSDGATPLCGSFTWLDLQDPSPALSFSSSQWTFQVLSPPFPWVPGQETSPCPPLRCRHFPSPGAIPWTVPICCRAISFSPPRLRAVPLTVGRRF